MTDLADKVRSRIKIAENGCWVWQGAKNRKGYGVVGYWSRRTTAYAHRVMYEDARGAIVDGLQIDHLCRNPACCNPDHLEAVTPAENTRRGLSAQVARSRKHQKSHCRNGHAYTDENRYFDPNGHMSCRECRRIRNEKWSMLRRERTQVYRKLTAIEGNVISIGGR